MREFAHWFLENWETLAAIITGLTTAICGAITAIKITAMKHKLDGLDLNGDGKPDLPKDFDNIMVGCPKCRTKFKLKDLEIYESKQNQQEGQ